MLGLVCASRTISRSCCLWRSLSLHCLLTVQKDTPAAKRAKVLPKKPSILAFDSLFCSAWFSNRYFKSYFYRVVWNWKPSWLDSLCGRSISRISLFYVWSPWVESENLYVLKSYDHKTNSSSSNNSDMKRENLGIIWASSTTFLFPTFKGFWLFGFTWLGWCWTRPNLGTFENIKLKIS